MKNRSSLLPRCIATAMLSIGLFVGGTIASPATAQNAGIGAIMQSFMGANKQQVRQAPRQDPDAIVSVGGGLLKQKNAASRGNISLAPPKASRKAPPEYRGYNGRTVKQAYFGCKYESYRAATPGSRGQKIMEKMRVRMYVMDSCMNKEGFFRKNNQRKIFDISHLTAADFGFY